MTLLPSYLFRLTHLGWLGVHMFRIALYKARQVLQMIELVLYMYSIALEEAVVVLDHSGGCT